MNIFLFLLFMIPGTFFLGLMDIYNKRLLNKKFDPSFLVGADYVMAGIIMLFLSFFIGIPHLNAGFWGAIAATVLLNSISQVVWSQAFQKEDASLIAPLRLLTPPFVLLTGIVILGEIPSPAGILGLVITTAGLWLLLHDEKKKPVDGEPKKFIDVLKRKGVLLGILGAILFALSFPFDKKVVMTSSAVFGSALLYLGVGCSHFVYNMWKRPTQYARLWQEKKTFSLLLGAHVVGGFLCFQALPYTLAAYAAGGKRLWSVWTVILSGSFLKEKGIGRKLVATGIMLVGIVVSLVWE